MEPGDPSSYNRAGQVLLYHLGRPAGALAAFERAREVGPNYAPVYYSLHIYHLTRGELEEAGALIDAAKELARSEVERALYYGAQISLLTASGDYLKADADFRYYLGMIPGDYRVKHAHSLVERILGYYDEAEASLRTLQEGRRPVAVLLNDMGLIQRALGRPDSARVYFERAWELDTAGGEAGYNLALDALAEGDTSGALGWLARVEDRTPYWYPTALLAGRIHRAQGHMAMAERAFEVAYRLNPLSPVTSAELGRETVGLARGETGDSLLTLAENALLSGDMALAGHYSTRTTQTLRLRAPALIQANWSKVPTSSSHSVRVAQLEASLELDDDADKRILALAERELGNAHAHIGNLDDARDHLERSLELIAEELDLAAPAAAQLITLYLEIGEVEAAMKLSERLSGIDDPTLLAALAVAAATAGDDAASEDFRQRSQAASYLPTAGTSTDKEPN